MFQQKPEMVLTDILLKFGRIENKDAVGVAELYSSWLVIGLVNVMFYDLLHHHCRYKCGS
jgi:hypothetical protein